MWSGAISLGIPRRLVVSAAREKQKLVLLSTVLPRSHVDVLCIVVLK